MLGGSVKRSQSAMIAGHKDVEYINKLRELLINENKRQAGKHRNSVITAEKQILKLNDAKKARVFRPVPCRVSSAVKGSRHLGHSFSVCDRGHMHTHNDTSLILAQSCDVLGPHSCSDCIKARYRNKYTEETTKCFPELTINQRVLCAQSRMKYMFRGETEKSQAKVKRSRASKRHKNIEDALAEKNKIIPPVPSFTKVVTDNEIQLRVMEDVRQRPKEVPSFITGRRRLRTRMIKKEIEIEERNLLGPILVDSEKEANRKSWNVMPS